MTGAANQTEDDDSSRAPGLIPGFLWSMNAHRSPAFSATLTVLLSFIF